MISNAGPGATSTAGTSVGGAGGTATTTGSGGEGGGLFLDGGMDAGCVDGETCGDAGGVCAGGFCCEASKACAFGVLRRHRRLLVPEVRHALEPLRGRDRVRRRSILRVRRGRRARRGRARRLVPGRRLAADGEMPAEAAGVRAWGSRPATRSPASTKCEYKPPVGQFSPVLKYSWGDPAAALTKDSVMMAPVVVQLDDDTCDGVVDERDIPEIVFSTLRQRQLQR